MKNPRFKNYIYWGTTALAVVACSVAFGFFLSRFEIVSRAVGKIVSILMPIIYGAVLAYLMLPIYNKTRVYTTEKLKRCIKDGHTADSLAKAAGTLVSLLLLIAIVCGLFWMVIPQIYTSIIGLQESLGENINNLSLWLMKMFEDNPTIEQTIMPFYEQAATEFQNWLTTDLVPNMSKIIGELSTGLLSVVTVVKNILIGVIVMVYFLNIKDTLSAQSKKIVYSLLKLKDGERGAFCPLCIWRFYNRKAFGFPDYWHYVLFCHAVFKNALCASGERDYRSDQRDPLFRPLYRSRAQRISHTAGEPYEMPVFPYLHPGAPAV